MHNMTTQIKLRRDTAINWTTANPVLALGEPGLETDTRKIKYGDGSTAWNLLAYSASGTPGADGASSFEIAVANGFVGNESAWLASLVGAPGSPGAGVPIGGTTGQVLAKVDGTDFNTEWINQISSATNEITNTDGTDAYSVSVGTNGVITMTTARGGIEFGAQPEPGGPSHLHIMRPAGQNGSSDLYFGDDYNYVKMPGLYGSNPSNQQGVEIGSSLNEGTVSVWKFGTDGHMILPAGGDIKDITGTSVLGGGTTNTGDITFSGGIMTGTNGEIRMQVLSTQQIASYSFIPGIDYSTAVWDGTGITFNDPTQPIYDAIWSLSNFSTIQVQVAGNWFTVTSSGSSMPGMPQAPTLFVNESAVGGPLNIDIVDITINQGTSSYAEIDGTDFRVDVQDDIRMYSNDIFRLINRSTNNGIEIQTNDGQHVWEFNPDGTLTLPSSGDILRNGNSVIPNLATVATTGNYNDLNDKPNLIYRSVIAPVTSKGQQGDQQNDIAFDGNYVYYCSQNYNAGYQVTLGSGYSGGPYPYLLKGDYPQPQPGWTFVWETVTYTIITVTDPNAGEWQLEVNQTINTGAGGTITLALPAVDIWKRVAFSVDTW